jgi:hypothetical protein
LYNAQSRNGNPPVLANRHSETFFRSWRGPDLILLDLGGPAGEGFVVLPRFETLMNTATIRIIVVRSRTSVGNPYKPVDMPISLKTSNETLDIASPEPTPPLRYRRQCSRDFVPRTARFYFSALSAALGRCISMLK